MNIIQILYLAMFAALISCGGSDKRSLREAPPEKTLDNVNGVIKESESFKELYLTHVRPVLKANCSGCHIHSDDGAHPFAGTSDDLSVTAGQRLIGESLASSRFYVKVSDQDNPHPTAKISAKALPDLKAGLEAFFSKVGGSGTSNGIFAAPFRVNKALERWPEINPSGFLIVELEGATLDPDSKFLIKPGTYSGDLAVQSNFVPANPVSGAARTYTSNLCSNGNMPPSITQVAHTEADNAKYFIPFNAAIIDAAGTPLVRGGTPTEVGQAITVNNIIRVLPGNKLPPGGGQSLDDVDYDTPYTPTVNSMVWSSVQLDHFYAQLKNQGKNQDFTAAEKQAYDSMLASLDTEFATDKSSVLKYMNLTFGNRTSGQINFSLFAWDNAANDRTTVITSGNIHRDEAVPLDEIENKYKNPGWARYTFSVPKTLDFPDESITAEAVPIRIYHRASGQFRFRVQDVETGEFIKVAGNNTCPAVTGNSAYSRSGNLRFVLKPGGTYTVWMGQVDQETVVDSIMIVVDSELNEDAFANPNRNPIVLRNKHYGVGGNGVQNKIKVMPFRVYFGSLELEMDDRRDFYSMTLPVFRMDDKYKDKNVFAAGFDFRVNGNVSLTNRNFKFEGVRAANDIVSYGEVMIPKIKPDDELNVRFEKLELTDQASSKPTYAEAPPQEGLICNDPEYFRDQLWPVYYQQKVVLREEYDAWRASWTGENNTPVSFGTEISPAGGTVETATITAEPPTVYTCTSCHNEDHPFLELVEEDFIVSCNKILQRANLENPIQSFSLRGLRGQFNHLPLYTIFNPWDGNNLRKQGLPSGEQLIWGPLNGKALKANTKAEVDALVSTATSDNQIRDLYRSLTQPDRVGFRVDSSTGVFERIPGTNEALLVDLPAGANEGIWNLLITPDEDDDILSDHNATVDKWVNRSFLEWIKREKRALGK